VTALKRSEALSVRLDNRTKEGLEAAAERNRSTISREAAERLARSLATDETLKPDFDSEEDRALANLLVMLHRRLRQMTGRSWRDDRYTFRAFAAGIALLLEALPRMLGFSDGEGPVPERLAQIYRDSPRALLHEAADTPSAPELGRGTMVGMLDVLLLYDGPGPLARHRTGYVREHWELPQIYHDLRLGRSRPDLG
jgi:hypothetical protein